VASCCLYETHNRKQELMQHAHAHVTLLLIFIATITASDYTRSSTGYILSSALVKYLYSGRQHLESFVNEDVTVGSWLMGVDR
jgi:Galactosyltransferase